MPTLQRCITASSKTKQNKNKLNPYNNTTTIVLQPFVQDYTGEPVPEETFTHPPSSSSSNLYQLLPSTTIHSILPVQIPCLAIFLHNLSPRPFWSTSWSGAFHLIFYTFLYPYIVIIIDSLCCLISCNGMCVNGPECLLITSYQKLLNTFPRWQVLSTA